MITLIAARDRNGAIGKDGDIPWRAPEDLRMFKQETEGGALIMGRRTWESLPRKPLPGRLNCVVSRNPNAAETVAPDIRSGIDASIAAGRFRIYGIGGARIYQEMLPLADRLLVTEVELEVEGADAFFPAFAEDDWIETQRVEIRSSAPRCVLRELIRARSS